ncbi:hypothetical protein [Collimonas humicola]|uniref:hypothetical protein n=1 Tax=Collimonas humicola TaxID=2825886 RepID=UPI001B8CC33B|nr:hypothetical protein [Collimonas humicola]
MVHELLEAIASGNPWVIVLGSLVPLTPVLKLIIEWNIGRHTLKKDRQSLFVAAINSSLEKAEGQNSSFLNYQLEQTFESYYGKRLHHFEIRKILNTPKPSYFTRQYLIAHKFLKMENKKEVPGKIRFKNKPKRYRISYLYWTLRFFPALVLQSLGYFIFASSGMFLMLKLFPLAAKQENVSAEISVVLAGVSLIIFSVSFLVDAVKLQAALRLRIKNY